MLEKLVLGGIAIGTMVRSLVRSWGYMIMASDGMTLLSDALLELIRSVKSFLTFRSTITLVIILFLILIYGDCKEWILIQERLMA